MNRKRVQVGIIGLGQVWENEYRPALMKLRDRIQVTAVNDCIPARANQIANGSEVRAIHSLSALANSSDVRALLFLESDWRGTAILPLLLESRKPLFLVESFGNDLQRINQTRALVESNDLTVVPEFTERYTPASCRLQELLATSLGAVIEIRIDAILPKPTKQLTLLKESLSQEQVHFLVNLFDWCKRILRCSPSQLSAKKIKSEQSEQSENMPNYRLSIEYPEKENEGQPVNVEVTFRVTDDHTNENSSRILYEIACEEGSAIMNSATEISWHLNREEQVHETLTAERSSVEVMLDHFCRRVVGGLVPVADLDDVARSLQLVLSVEQSLQENQEIDLLKS